MNTVCTDVQASNVLEGERGQEAPLGSNSVSAWPSVNPTPTRLAAPAPTRTAAAAAREASSARAVRPVAAASAPATVAHTQITNTRRGAIAGAQRRDRPRLSLAQGECGHRNTANDAHYHPPARKLERRRCPSRARRSLALRGLADDARRTLDAPGRGRAWPELLSAPRQ